MNTEQSLSFNEMTQEQQAEIFIEAANKLSATKNIVEPTPEEKQRRIQAKNKYKNIDLLPKDEKIKLLKEKLNDAIAYQARLNEIRDTINNIHSEDKQFSVLSHLTLEANTQYRFLHELEPRRMDFLLSLAIADSLISDTKQQLNYL